jgi:hypothetical protein
LFPHKKIPGLPGIFLFHECIPFPATLQPKQLFSWIGGNPGVETATFGQDDG